MTRPMAVLLLSLCLPAGAVVASTVTPEQVTALPIGAAFVGVPSGQFVSGTSIPQGTESEVELVRTADGYTYIHADGGRGGAEAQKVACNNISKSGGKGNATINCELAGGKQVRFEWLAVDKVKFEYWFSMKDKAGKTQHRPAQASTTLAKREPVRSGKVISPGTYMVTFNTGWAPVTYVLEANGKFLESGAKSRTGSWQEIDGDFCHIDGEVHCYKLMSKEAGGKSVKLLYKKPDGTNGHIATWARM